MRSDIYSPLAFTTPFIKPVDPLARFATTDAGNGIPGQTIVYQINFLTTPGKYSVYDSEYEAKQVRDWLNERSRGYPALDKFVVSRG